MPPAAFPKTEPSPTEAMPEPDAPEPVEEEPRAVASPWLLRVITIAIVLFGLGALATVVSVSFFLNREIPAPKQVSQEGLVTFDTKPTGASVRWNGQTIGTTPLTGFHLPIGQQALELRFPGYASKVVNVTISDGTINNLGLVGLVRENGQFVVKTNPPGVPFEITGTDQKTTSGITPLTSTTCQPVNIE